MKPGQGAPGSWYQAEWTRARDGATIYSEIHDNRRAAVEEIPTGKPVKLTEIPRAKGDRKAEAIRAGLLHTPTPRAERR